MELHQLRYFVAVATQRSFSRAATGLHVSQPSLSQQIRELEEELGQPLLDRLARSVVPTEAGKRFLVCARRALAKISDARRCVNEYRGRHVERLVVGAIPTIAPYVLPRLIRKFRRLHPDMSVEVVEDLTPATARMKEFASPLPQEEYVRALIAANDKLVADAATARDLAGDANDPESQDPMIGRITLHQKTIWMLKSFLKGCP